MKFFNECVLHITSTFEEALEHAPNSALTISLPISFWRLHALDAVYQHDPFRLSAFSSVLICFLPKILFVLHILYVSVAGYNDVLTESNLFSCSMCLTGNNLSL
jgi:hypothetical protein